MPGNEKRSLLPSIIGLIILLVILVVIVEKLGWSATLSNFFAESGGIFSQQPQPLHLIDPRGNVIEMVWIFFLAAILGGIVPYKGRLSHYQYTVLQAHMILSVSAAMMMMIIGSELARAFGLMGAAGIVRYRYRLINPKEGSTLIVALGVGMACGTGLKLLAVVATIVVVVILNLQYFLPRQILTFVIGPRFTTRLKYTIETQKWKESLEQFQKVLQELKIDFVVASTKHRLDDTNETDIIIEMSHPSPESIESLSHRLKEINVQKYSWKEINIE